VQFAVAHRAPGIPERCGLGFGHVAHYQPIELRQPAMHERGIVTTDRRVLAEHEHATDDAVTHRQGHRQLRMVPDDARHPAKAEVVVHTGGIAVIRLQKADRVFREIVPPSGRRPLVLEIFLQCGVRLECVRLRQVGRQHVV
jgi:hypothetical protein